MFNDLSYGGTLIRDLPGVPVFVDDRFGLYGDEFVAHYCEAVLEPEANATRLFDRWQIQTVLVGLKWPLGAWLNEQPEWARIYADDAAAVYTRQPTVQEHVREAY
jgi:hypothetical protein